MYQSTGTPFIYTVLDGRWMVGAYPPLDQMFLQGAGPASVLGKPRERDLVRSLTT